MACQTAHFASEEEQLSFEKKNCTCPSRKAAGQSFFEGLQIATTFPGISSCPLGSDNFAILPFLLSPVLDILPLY